MSNFHDTSSELKRQIEAWFADNPNTEVATSTIAARLGVTGKRASTIIYRMLARGDIFSRKVRGHNQFWSGTPPEAEEKLENVAGSRLLNNGTQTDPYLGEELRRNPGIPAERFAAFDLPSLVSGVRVPPRSLAAGCTTSIPYVSRRNKCL